MPAPAATLLLPARDRLAGVALPARVARALGRADRLPLAEAGERAQVLRHFTLLPRGWPVAALSRVGDAGDARAGTWLRADPAYIRPDINGARLLGVGAPLGLSQADTDAFLPALRPLFGDAGFPLDAPRPHRWYLRLPPGSPLPAFPAPGDVLGADLLDHLPGAGEDTGPGARRWRTLLSEAQVVLHNHPRNAARAAAGLVPVNSLWCWGAGALPDQVTATLDVVQCEDVVLRALADLAGARVAPLPARYADPPADMRHGMLIDLRPMRDPRAWLEDWLEPALDALDRRALSGLCLDFEDGARFELARGQRWRAWRRPLSALDA